MVAEPKPVRPTWRNLLFLAVIGNLVILLYMAIALGDTLALALTAIFVIGLGLLKFRSGVLGIIVIGLLNADIAVWTVSGAVSNFLSGENLPAMVLPGFLGVVSLMGVTLNLSNRDLWWHTFTIDELGVDLKVPMGAEREVTFSAPAGTYKYYCSIPGHDAIMHGTLSIKGD